MGNQVEIVVEVVQLDDVSLEQSRILSEVARQRKLCFEHGKWD